MTDTNRYSHRNLGLFPAANPYERSANPPRGFRAGTLDDYHAFAGIDTQRKPVDQTLMVKLAELVVAQPSVDRQLKEAGTDAAEIAKILNMPVSGPDGSHAGGIGAGYTYLFQLAAHDIVSTEAPAGNGPPYPNRLRNRRHAPLMLETVLGDGPLGCPFAYDTAPPSMSATANGPAKLRLGCVRELEVAASPPPARDLPRMNFDPSGVASPSKAGRDTVLIPDARNDDNMILAQLTALFHGIYNHILDRLSKDIPETRDLSVFKIEELARYLLIRLYHRILRLDLLARILHPMVFASYNDPAKSPVGLDTAAASNAASIEFAFAAGRMGHCMVRPGYKMNRGTFGNIGLGEVIKTSTSHSPRRLPHLRQYLADWDLFFPPVSATTADEANWAVRFGTRISLDMTSAAAIVTPDPDDPGQMISGTPVRDYLREASWPLAMVEELIEKILAGSSGAALAKALAPYLDAAGKYDPSVQDHILSTGLNKLLQPPYPLVQLPDIHRSEVESLIDNPPLFLFLQFEADLLGAGGTTLGPIGSILVAEAMWPVFRPASWETGSAQLDDLETQIFGSLPDTMPNLLAALRARAAHLFAT